MSFSLVLGLLGGLALFLYGMQMMSQGLEAAAGNRMKGILEKLTANRFLGVAVGAAITAIIQSSSATTVMVVGFVNSGLMTLNQAVWIIMGANIGTTITGQLVALDVGALAPLFAFIGVALVVFFKKVTFHNYGQIIAGFGILFIGMEMMSSSMAPLRENEAFVNMMTSFSNPILGIIAGAVFTAIIQSSSASVGILQALAVGGLIGLDNAVFVLFGQNIGTCITAILASIGTSRNAKRTTIIHLMFNIIGTAIFTIVCLTTPLTDWVTSWTPDRVAAQIANMHTLFNVTTTLILLPFGNYLAALATKILPEHVSEIEETQRLKYLKPVMKPDEYAIGTSSIIMNGVHNELKRMAEKVRKNVEESFDAVSSGTTAKLAGVTEREEYIDFLNKEISRYISNMMIHETNAEDLKRINAYFKVCTNLERIGDHAMNICEYTKLIEEKRIRFTPEAMKEMAEMQAASLSCMDMIAEIDTLNLDKYTEVAAMEQKIDDMTDSFRENQIVRMRHGACDNDGAVLYTELLTDFERMGDHMLNIAQELAADIAS